MAWTRLSFALETRLTQMVSICSRVLAAATAVLIAGSVINASARGLPGIEGIRNFAKVSDVLYRGAEPGGPGMESLKSLGVKSVVDLRMGKEVLAAEKEAALAGGVFYTNIPLRGLGRPTEQQVAAVLHLIETLPGPVFIHCQHGCDRTGTIIACYRIRQEHWTSKAALNEARKYGMSVFEFGMRRYVRAFGRKHFNRPAAIPTQITQSASYEEPTSQAVVQHAALAASGS